MVQEFGTGSIRRQKGRCVIWTAYAELCSAALAHATPQYRGLGASFVQPRNNPHSEVDMGGVGGRGGAVATAASDRTREGSQGGIGMCHADQEGAILWERV